LLSESELNSLLNHYRSEEEEFELKSLSLELNKATEFFLKHWKFSKPEAEPYIHRMLEKLPSSGIFIKDDQLVAGILLHTNGLMGMLSTEQNHRNRGFATRVTKQLWRQMLRDDMFPVSSVERNNEASIQFHKKLGMRISHRVDHITHQRSSFS
jgi:predicted GNAT family acetyltransferase